MPQESPRIRFRFVTRPAIKRLAILSLLANGFLVWAYFAMIHMPGKSHHGPLPSLSAEQEVLRDALRDDVDTLARKIGDRNVFRHENLAAAAAFLETSLAEAGYEVARQEFEVFDITCVNLEAEITGASRPEEIVVVGGHYDSVFGCPAANDNASGTAATLALARAFAGTKPARTVRFVLFTNEEPPHFQTPQMGSLVYARRCRARGERIVAMLSLETIGYYSDADDSQGYPFPFGLFYPTTGNFIAFVGNVSSRGLVRDCVASFRRHARFPSEGGALPSFIGGVGWSDHWSFWQEGYPALMVTDTAPFRYPHYHTHEDTPDKLDYDRMALVVAGLEKVVGDLVIPAE